jgi:hypothetical protein
LYRTHANLNPKAVLLSNIRVMLVVLVAFANACCYARCVVQFCDSGAPSCHEHGKSNASHCLQQHDLNVAPATANFAVAVAMPVRVSSSIGMALERALESSDLWPLPLPRSGTPQPLRI